MAKVQSKYNILVSCIFIFLGSGVYAQVSVIKDDYKKELWKTIKPTDTSPLSPSEQTMKSISEDPLFDNDIAKYYNNYLKKPNLGPESEYKLNPNLLIFNSKTPLNQLPPGSTQVVYMGGHFVIIPTGGSLIYPSGLDLSGGGRKVVSEKSKLILRSVFGIETK